MYVFSLIAYFIWPKCLCMFNTVHLHGRLCHKFFITGKEQINFFYSFSAFLSFAHFMIFCWFVVGSKMINFMSHLTLWTINTYFYSPWICKEHIIVVESVQTGATIAWIPKSSTYLCTSFINVEPHFTHLFPKTVNNHLENKSSH